MNDPIPFWPRANLFETLCDEDLARVLALGRARAAAAGEEIIRQGGSGEHLVVVETGELAIIRRLPGDEEEILGIAGTGALLGEMATLERVPRTASLRAVSPSTVRIIDVRAFETLVLDGGPAGHRVLRAVATLVHRRLAATQSALAARLAECSQGASLQATEAAAPVWSEPSEEHRGVLGVLPCFEMLTADEIAEVASRIEVGSVSCGQHLSLPEAGAGAVTLVLRGALSPLLAFQGGGALALPVAAPGSFLDYSAAVDAAVAQRSWRVRSPSIVGRIPVALFTAESAIGARLLYSVCRGLAATLRRTTGLTMHFGMAWARDPS